MLETSGPAANTEVLHALYGGWIKRIALVLQSRMPWADLDELLQWGAIGMLEAMNRFDRTLGVEFQAFAMRRVRGAMLNGLRREGVLRRGESLFDADAVDSAAFLGGTSPEDPLARLVRSDSNATLAAALRSLPELDYRVLALHFYDEMNNREIAALLDISEGYVSRVRKRALETLAGRMSAQSNGATV